ncbi:MAG: hypothetical protein FWD24_03860 [Treponema sp.]|nr:hypothetical protein [Treponema sp.]
MLYRKICNIALFFTSIFAFFTWSLTNSISFPYLDNIIIKFLINFASAYGFFRIIVTFAAFILERIPIVKKKIFKSSYFEGTWVGYYQSPSDDKHVVFYQTIEQSFDNAQILSKAYNLEDMNFRGIWISTSSISIKPQESELSYLYKFDSSSNNNLNTNGLFIANYQKGKSKIPFRITGHSFNVTAKTKIKTELIKVSDKTIINDEKKVKQDALNFYKEEEEIKQLKSS